MTICKGNNSISSETLTLKQLTKMAIKRETSMRYVATTDQQQLQQPSDEQPLERCSSENDVEPRRFVCRSYSDDSIQSSGSRRRYMRRGSRAPSMFVISKTDLENILDNNDLNQQQRRHSDKNNQDDETMEDICSMKARLQTRRLSLTTTLFKQLEALSIQDSKLNTSSRHGAMKLRAQRRFSTDGITMPYTRQIPIKPLIPVLVTQPQHDEEYHHPDHSSLHDDSASTISHELVTL